MPYICQLSLAKLLVLLFVTSTASLSLLSSISSRTFFCNTEFPSSLSPGLPLLYGAVELFYTRFDSTGFPDLSQLLSRLDPASPGPKMITKELFKCFLLALRAGIFLLYCNPQKIWLIATHWVLRGFGGLGSGQKVGYYTDASNGFHVLWFCHINMKHLHSGCSVREFLVTVTLFL